MQKIVLLTSLLAFGTAQAESVPVEIDLAQGPVEQR